VIPFRERRPDGYRLAWEKAHDPQSAFSSSTIRPTMRALLLAPARDPAIRVIGAAADPLEARALIKALNPDVLTLMWKCRAMNASSFLNV